MGRWLPVLLTMAIWIALDATPVLAGRRDLPEPHGPYVAFGSILLFVCFVIYMTVRVLSADRAVEDPETLVQQILVDREGREEPDHVVVGPGLQDHDAVVQAPLHDRVPVGAG